MQKNKETNQQKFVERIKQALPQNYSLVNELSDLLGISDDSAYRRIRSETTFSFDEIIKICNHYKISFDSFCTSESGVVNFSYELLQNNKESFGHYISGMLNDLKKIAHIQEAEIIYAAEDIPVFHLFKFPDLAAFKMFYWMKSVLNVPEFEGKKYDSSLIDSSIMDNGKQILNLYTKIPCTEIWSDRTISSIIKQIDFYHETGLFKKKDEALHLCTTLADAMNDIQEQAERTTKASVAGFENNFIMYNSDIEIGNNYILVNAAGIKTLYLRHHTFNNMVTTNAAFCDETEQWLKGLIKKSTLISGVSEKQRYQFFRKAQDKIERLKMRVG
ncbi:MAG: hypothetical protein WC868_02695 [Bacteroidales bacterium]